MSDYSPEWNDGQAATYVEAPIAENYKPMEQAPQYDSQQRTQGRWIPF